MPGDGTYLGDYAGVIPDNQEPLLHLNDQFMNIENQYRQQQMLKAKADAVRQQKLGEFIGKTLDAKGLLNGNPEDPNIHQMVNDAIEKNTKDILSGVDAPTIMGNVVNAANGIAVYSQKAKAANSNIATGVAAYAKEHPEIDATALAGVAGKQMFYKKDANGNDVLKDPSEIDPQYDAVTDAVVNHGDKLWPGTDATTGIGPSINNMVTKDKPISVGGADTYDQTTGKRTVVGYKGSVPTFMGPITDNQGNPVLDQKTGLPTLDVHHMNYQLPGTNNDYIDPGTKQPVKVATPDVYAKFMTNPGVAAGVEQVVQKNLDAINNYNKANGIAPVDANGPIADMLRKKTVYDQLSTLTQGRNYLIPNEDKSIQNAADLEREKIAKGNLGLKWAEFNKNNPDTSKWPNIVDQLNGKAGEDLTTKDGQPVRFIDQTNIDQNDVATLQGKAAVTTTDSLRNKIKAPIVQPMTIVTNDGKTKTGFAVTANGDLMGAGNQIIDRNAAQTRAIDEVKKETLSTKQPVTLRTKITNAVKKVRSAFQTTKGGAPIIN